MIPTLQPNWDGYLRRIAEGEQDALAVFYDATNHLVYGMALRILGNTADAEEITLDTYTQIWRKAGNFDGTRGSVLAWLMTIARTRAIDRLRSGTGNRQREEPLEENQLPSRDLADPLLDGRDVRAALNALAPEQREAIELAYWYGYSHTELATRLGQPLGTIKTRIRLGMMKLRSQLEGCTA
ncbi:MAG: sigma-70 family RNA polymerase sigma factor [Bryobacteraceae bacterium]